MIRRTIKEGVERAIPLARALNSTWILRNLIYSFFRSGIMLAQSSVDDLRRLGNDLGGEKKRVRRSVKRL